jgi:hypothetical protein
MPWPGATAPLLIIDAVRTLLFCTHATFSLYADGIVSFIADISVDH